MNRKKSAAYGSLFTLAFCLSLGFMPVFQAMAQTVHQVRLTALKIKFEPPGRSIPKDSVGGASRNSGQCPQDSMEMDSHLMAVLPKTNQGLTVASHPTFFVYIPKTNAEKAFFSLQDENGNEHYQAFVSIKGEDGVIKLKLPNEARDLEVGKNYRWSFAIMCDNNLRPDSPMVEGEIQRIEANSTLMGQLKKATPIETASLYASAGIWHDTLSAIADLRNLQPNDTTLTTTWESLLSSQGLDKIATKPLVE
jgi:Domain of Unknown Function (DUF928)